MKRTFERHGRQFGVKIEYDDAMGPPWKEHDGHGVVTEWVRREKRAGEQVLCQDQGSFRYYDVAATMPIAKRDGWGPREQREGETKGQKAARAVADDFEYLRRWCNDLWHWCGVVVVLLDVEGNPTTKGASLWGIESDSYDYHETVARELADQILTDHEAFQAN